MIKDLAKLKEIYDLLLEFYGSQGWWPVTPPGGRSPVYSGGPVNDSQRLEVIVGAILTQNTSWSGARKALENLIAQKELDFPSLLAIDESRLASLIRPSGYFNQKARRIKSIVAFLDRRYEDQWEKLFCEQKDRMREILLGLNGIGPETADSIILYAAGKPSFVIDAYTRRLCHRLGLTDKDIGYEKLKRLFEKSLDDKDKVQIYNEYHALIVIHGKKHCTSRKPLCEGCPLWELCQFRGEPPFRKE